MKYLLIRRSTPLRQGIGGDKQTHRQQWQNETEFFVGQHTVNDQCEQHRHQQNETFWVHFWQAKGLRNGEHEWYKCNAHRGWQADGEIPIPWMGTVEGADVFDKIDL